MEQIIIKDSENSEVGIILSKDSIIKELTEKISSNLIEKFGLTKELKPNDNEKTDIHDGLTITETAKYLGVSKVTVHRLMNDGEITYFKIRRRSFITKDSIKNYIEKNTYSQNEV